MSQDIRKTNWAFTLSLAAIAVAYLSIVWLPGQRSIRQLLDQVQSKQATIAAASELSATLVKSQHELDTTEATVARWQKNIPGERVISRLYGKIDLLAKGCQLATSRFDPQPTVAHEKLLEIPITIDCTGTFTQVYEFLRGLEQLPAVIWIESMRLDAAAQAAQDVRCELSLVVFSDNPKNSDYAIRSN